MKERKVAPMQIGDNSVFASHRLHSSLLSDEENKLIYGKCNNLNGHGHNYTVQVTVKAQIGKTGMVMNMNDLKWHIRSVLDVMDHKNLDEDVLYFGKGDVVSTVENICIFIWRSLVDILPDPQILHKVKVWETENNAASYKGIQN